MASELNTKKASKNPLTKALVKSLIEILLTELFYLIIEENELQVGLNGTKKKALENHVYIRIQTNVVTHPRTHHK